MPSRRVLLHYLDMNVIVISFSAGT